MSTAQKVPSVVNGSDETQKPTRNGVKQEFELDVPKLHALPAEQQDLYLFTFVTSLERRISSIGLDVLKQQQVNLKKELLQAISLPTPAPSRTVRHSIGRCFLLIFTRGDTRLLFETITELGEMLLTGKGDREPKNKHAAVYSLGEIYKAVGDGAIQLSNVVCSSLIKLLKSSTGNVALRAAIFKTLGKVSASIQGSLDESIARDIWKQARSAASGDRGFFVQVSAFWCIEQLVQGTSYFNNTSDFDSLKTTVWKAGDSPASVVRHASASCLSSMLVKGYLETASIEPLPKTPKLKKPRKVNAGQSLGAVDAEDSDSARLASPTWKRNSMKLELTLPDILRQLFAQYVSSATSNRGRVAILSCYSKFLRSVDKQVVESNYGIIADNLLIDILSNPQIIHHRYRLLLTRRLVQKLLSEVIGRQILGETAQLNAAKILINDFLKNFPRVLKERPEPSKNTLTGALNALGSFVKLLGSAFSPLADSCREALIQVVQHPSYTVQIHASYCLRLFTLACPQQLMQCASICMNNVDRELSLLNTARQSARRCVGYANGLAAVLSISSLQPLYSSIEISSRVLQQATNLLKSSVNADLRVSGLQLQVAWILIGGLMSLGPNFTKIHISQLLLLWRNALPKTLTKENAGQRLTAEISYLVHVRECALGSILSFLEFNGRLLTADVSKRIATMLTNTIEFLDHLPVSKKDGEISPRITPSLQLHDLVQMVRRRVLQCYTRLATRAPQTNKEALSQSQLLTFAVSCFAEPEGYYHGSIGTAIANSPSHFESVWNMADNSGFGITGLMRALEIKPLPGEHITGNQSGGLQLGDIERYMDQLLMVPVCGAMEHDSVYMHLPEKNEEELPDPPATEVVNSAIALFSMALPLQEPKVQESVLEQLSTFLSAKILQRDPGRKAAITVNIALAVLGALKVSLGETLASAGDLKYPPAKRCLDELLQTLIIDQDQYVRNAAYEALGRLCNGSGDAFTTSVVNSLVDTIVANREPSARAGCAMALGSIHSNVGGMAAGFHLRKIHGVLMSLCSDPHPTVHFWAIEALGRVAESAGLSFSGYLPSTLGLLAQIWISDAHSEEADSIGTSNAEVDFPSPGAIASTIASLINVLGPDLQDMSKVRELILTLVRQFDIDDLPMVKGQALRCWEHVYLYAPAHVNFTRYVRQLQRGLDSTNAQVRSIAIEGLHNLIQRRADQTFIVATNGIEEQIWGLLDEPFDQKAIRRVIDVWLNQTALTHTEQWVARCQTILTKTVPKISVDSGHKAEPKTLPSAVPEIQDEEVAGFNLTNPKDEEFGSISVGQELLRWQIRAFALQCLSDVLAAGARELQSNPKSIAGNALQQKVAELIRTAFLASTSSVVELRIAGLRLIEQVLMTFGATPDPDFSEALLLEQYQAQISSALTPAFGADSSPDLASAAVSVCATFISTGLVTDVERMGRILKLLTSALASFTIETEDPIIGELSGLTTNAQTNIKMAVFSAWAELQVASTEKRYLVEVVKPHVAKLTPLWLSSLQEFARLRFEPDISSSMVVSSSDRLDVIYAALNRQTLLKFYQDSWLKLINAIASLVEQDSNFVFDALDRKKESISEGNHSKGAEISYRDEPVAFFFILYGIAFEALITRPGTDSQDTRDQVLDILLALKKILRPSVAGHAIYQDVVFTETMDLFDRLALTEGFPIQGAIVEITRNLCLSHPSVEGDEGEEHLTDDIEQLFELTRIIVLILTNALPSLGEKPSATRQQITDEAASLIILSLEALVDAADVFPSVIRTDLHACIIHIFTTMLGTGACQTSVVPRALPLFKRFIHTITEDLDENPGLQELLRSCLYRLRSILANAQRREAEASLLCARNTLMALVVLLTSGSEAIAPNDPLATKCLEDFLDCLQDLGIAKVAANCMRSLLLTKSKSDTSQAVSRYLFPRLVYFLVDESQQDPENARTSILQSLISFVTTLDGEECETAMCIVIPILLHNASLQEQDTYQDVATKLLTLAGADQTAFKGFVTKLSPEQRAFLEEIIRIGGGGRRGDGLGGNDRGEPAIALKMTFGS